MRKITAVALAVAVCAFSLLMWPKTVEAIVPKVVTVEAFLSDSVTGPINGVRDITIGIYDDNAPVPQWEATFEVEFIDGRVSFEIGVPPQDPIEPGFFDVPEPNFKIEVENVSGRVTLPIRSTPFALVAARTVSSNASGLIGIVPSLNIMGKYPGIVGVGQLMDLRATGDAILYGNLKVTGNSGYGIMFPDGTMQTTAFPGVMGPMGTNGIWTFNGNDIYRITGNIGIGETNPSEKLHVVGKVRIDDPLIGPPGGIQFPDGTMQMTAFTGSSLGDGDWEITGNHVIRPSGNVGIGPNIPIAPLDFGTRTGHVLRIDPMASSTAFIGRDQFNGLEFDFGEGQVLNSTAHLIFNIDSNNDENFRFFDVRRDGVGDSGGVSLLRVLESGYVGIGLVSPTEKLEVSGNAKIHGTVYSEAFSSLSPLYLQTSGITRVLIDDIDGFVAINHMDPRHYLTVSGNMEITGNVGNGILFPDGTFQSTAFGGSAGGDGDWEIVGLNVVRVPNQVAVGTKHPFAKFAVKGTIGIISDQLDELVDPAWIFEHQANSPIADNGLAFKRDDIVWLVLGDQAGSGISYFPTGNVGIGTDNPDETLTVSGNVSANGTVYATAFSSHSPLLLQTSHLGVDTTRIYVHHEGVTEGFVGIENLAPDRLLHIGDDTVLGSEGLMRFQSRTNTGGSAARTWDIGVPMTGDTTATGPGYSFIIDDIGTSFTDFMVKWGTGYVGIGLDNPTERLTVSGNVSTNATIYGRQVMLGMDGPVMTPRLKIFNGTDAALAGINGFAVFGEESGLNVVMDNNEIMARNNGGSSQFAINHDGGDVLILGTGNPGSVGVGGPVALGYRLNVVGSANVVGKTKTDRLRVTGVGSVAPMVGDVLVATDNLGNAVWTTPKFQILADMDMDTRIDTELTPDDDTLRFTTNGTERMQITSMNGYVGIGTSTPNEKLTVQGNVSVNGTVFTHFLSSHSPLIFQTSSGGVSPVNRMRIQDTGPSEGFVAIGDGVPDAPLDFIFPINGGSGQLIDFTPQNTAWIGPALTGSVLWDNSSGQHLLRLNSEDNLVLAFDANNNDTDRFLDITHNGGASLMRVLENGNVGVGTPLPTQHFQVGDVTIPDSQGMARFESRSGAGTAARAWEFGVPETDQVTTTGPGYNFIIDDRTGGDPRPGDSDFAIDWQTGWVGIGVDRPDAKLQVSGNTHTRTLRVSGGSPVTGHVLVATDPSGNTTWMEPKFNILADVDMDTRIDTDLGDVDEDRIRFTTEGALRMIIDNTANQGRVGVNTPTPLQQFHVGGNSYFDGFVGINNSAPAFPLDFGTTSGHMIRMEPSVGQGIFLGRSQASSVEFHQSSVTVINSEQSSYLNIDSDNTDLLNTFFQVRSGGASVGAPNVLFSVRGDGLVRIPTPVAPAVGAVLTATNVQGDTAWMVPKFPILSDPDMDTRIETDFGTVDEDQIRFFTGGTERAVIRANGEVSFNHSVSVNGTVYASAYSTLSPMKLQTHLSGVDTTRMIIGDSFGHVGIDTGDTVPGVLLSLGGGADDGKFAIHEDIGGTGLRYGMGYQPNQFRFHLAGGGPNERFSFLDDEAGSNELFSIHEDGTVSTNGTFLASELGIGTPVPEQILHIGDDTVFGSDGMIRAQARSGTAPNASVRTWDFGVPETGEVTTGQGYSFIIDDKGPSGAGDARAGTDFLIDWLTGWVGIGLTAKPDSELEVGGKTHTDTLQVSGGTPAPGAVMVAADGAGNAAWDATRFKTVPFSVGNASSSVVASNSSGSIVVSTTAVSGELMISGTFGVYRIANVPSAGAAMTIGNFATGAVFHTFGAPDSPIHIIIKGVVGGVDDVMVIQGIWAPGDAAAFQGTATFK